MQWRLILDSLGSGLPVLVLHLATTLALLGLGVAFYMAVTPFNERRLIAAGNPAAGLVLGGTVIALALPLAATLATSVAALDIVIWGAVALVFQFIAFAVSAVLIRDLRTQIEAGNIAAAMIVVGIQIAFALINAAAMAG